VAEGVANSAIAAELGISVPTVSLWRAPFRTCGLAGLADGPRTGRPATYSQEIRERVLATT
jgi:transposase